uniref:Uncharacterized protein n=1 Tax=Arion vulgaris TaxID=1028688 RepID=A0A0B6ZGA4_9EUPU
MCNLSTRIMSMHTFILLKNTKYLCVCPVHYENIEHTYYLSSLKKNTKFLCVCTDHYKNYEHANFSSSAQ